MRNSHPFPIGIFICSLLLFSETSAAELGERSRPLTIDQVSSLEFGKFTFSGPGGGSISVDAAGNKRVSGSAVDMGGLHGPAVFHVRGEPGRQFIITLPNEAVLGAEKAAASARLEQFVSLPSREGTLGVTGEATIRVGATLRVSAQASATYRGDFEIYVDYAD